MAITYKDSGVDVTAGYKAVELMKRYVKETYNDNVVGDLGSFGGFYSLERMGLKNPVLVAGTDGVGTKLKYAFIMDKHDTIGIDAVAMCVNDVVCQGAAPLFFLDYIALPKLVPELVAEIVKGVSAGCKAAGCALIGGETAEMPGFYQAGEYDIAGFSVGITSREKVINGAHIKPGDVLVGIASSGIHSNGYSLVRKIFGEERAKVDVYSEELGQKIGDALLTPTRIYVKSILGLIDEVPVKGLAHITGGGFFENIPRMFPAGLKGKIDRKAYEVPALFRMMQRIAELEDAQIYNTFNMGVGMVACVAKEDADRAVAALAARGETAFVLGETAEGEGIELL